MTGQNLKNILAANGLQQKEIADKLCMSQQNFAAALKVQDVKTGFLEQLCDVLCVNMAFFYANTHYAPNLSITASGMQAIATASGAVSVGTKNNVDGDSIGTQYNYAGYDNETRKDTITTLTETVATLTKELDTSQQQKSHLIAVVATSQQQIQQLTAMVDRLTK